MNDPEAPIGLPEVMSRQEKTQAAARANPNPSRDKPGNPTGANQHTKRNGVKEPNEHHSRAGHGSTNAPRRIKNLRRDHPDVANPQPLNGHGGDRKGEQGYEDRNGNLAPPERGNAAPYRIRRQAAACAATRTWGPTTSSPC